MFEITFLGHQGWMFGSGNTHLMVDPLLEDFFGATALGGMRLYPPRKLDPSAAPAISAVVISHEHEDHFQLASLNRLDRRIPIYLSERCSRAAFAATDLLGFSVRPLRPDSEMDIGDLRLTTFTPELTPTASDEWDVLPFMVAERAGRGSFFSIVDLPPQDRLIERLVREGFRGWVSHADNSSSLHGVMSSHPAMRSALSPPLGALKSTQHLLTRLERYSALGIAGVVLSGGGWSFGPPMDWLNRCFFPTSHSRISDGLRMAQVGGPPLIAPLPGQTLQLQDNHIVDTRPLHPEFIECEPQQVWPERDYDPASKGPATLHPLLAGQSGPSILPRLELRLTELARGMVGGQMFRALKSLREQELKGLQGTMAIVALVEGEAGQALFEYQPVSCTFTRVEGNPRDYAAGLVCWAGDLLALLEGRTTAALFTMGHIFEWVNCAPRSPHTLSIAADLWTLFNPLRMPDQFFEFYRSVIADLRPAPQVPAATSAHTPAEGASRTAECLTN